MKQMRYILILITTAVIAPVYGQFPAAYGIKAGVSIANQSWRFSNLDYTLETEAIYSVCGALFVEAFKGEHFSFQFDLAYEQKGSSTSTESITVHHFKEGSITANEGTVSSSYFKYLSFSPMARYRFELEHLIPYLLLGPRLDVLLNYSTDSEWPLESWQGYAVGLTVGVGMEYSFGQMNLLTEIQFQPDLSPLTNQEPLLINNNMLAIWLGIRRVVSF